MTNPNKSTTINAVNNGELEVGFDEHFERQFGTIAFCGQLVLAGVVVLALTGLLGRGPYSHATVSAPDGSCWLDYEPISRFDTPTQVTLHFHTTPGQRTAQAFLSQTFEEPMGLASTAPVASIDASDGGGRSLTFATVGGTTEQLVRLQLKPRSIGPIQLMVRVGNAVPINWRQWVLP